MKEGHIYIYGEIIPFQDNDPGAWGGVNLKNVVSQIQAAKDAEQLTVHIHSPGGDVIEGFAIHDALKNSGKQIVTIIEGLCASIATIIALTGDERKMTENAEYMVHNPWGMVGGEASDMKKYADMLEKEESRMSNFYAEKTGLDVEDVKALMKAETWMNATEAKDKGFITEIITELKAVAKLKINNKMEKENEKVKGLIGKFEALYNKLTGRGEIKALVLEMGGGEILDFGEEVIEVADIAVGVPVSPGDENPLKEEYVMPDGRTLKVEGGQVSEIIEAEEESEENNDEVDALKAEIEELKSQLSAKAEAEQEAIKAKAEVETFKAEMENMKALVSDIKDDFSKREREDQNESKAVINRKVLN